MSVICKSKLNNNNDNDYYITENAQTKHWI